MFSTSTEIRRLLLLLSHTTEQLLPASYHANASVYIRNWEDFLCRYLHNKTTNRANNRKERTSEDEGRDSSCLSVCLSVRINNSLKIFTDHLLCDWFTFAEFLHSFCLERIRNLNLPQRDVCLVIFLPGEKYPKVYWLVGRLTESI